MVSFFYLANKHGIPRGDDVKIIFNGNVETIAQNATIASFIAQKALNPATIIVEHNYDLVKKESWENIILKEDDRLEILRFVGGG